MSELTEILAVNFGDKEGIPTLNPNWRWEDQEQALLSSCSSLIAIVGSDESRVVQFSHFSVKEFLTSDRLGTSSGYISRYHIVLEPAHAILTQACMSVLLRSDDRVEEGRNFSERGVGNRSPLAIYAAEHWVTHTQDGKASSGLRKAMEYLFDADKPYFAAWLQLHDIDTGPQFGSSFSEFTPARKSGATPLYYAALCGFQDLVEHLIVDDPNQVNATGGYYMSPLVAALAGRHFPTAKLLHNNDAHPNVRGHRRMTPLYSAAFFGDVEMVQVLLKYKADVNAWHADGRTPLHFASRGTHSIIPNIDLSLSKVARLILEHGADVNALGYDHSTPLHFAAQYGRVEVVHVLLEHVTNLAAEGDDSKTASQVVSEYVNSRNAEGQSPLHSASQGPGRNYMEGRNTALLLSNVTRLLLEHGADINALQNNHSTPLHVAARLGRVEVVHVLLEHGANVGAEDNGGKTAYHIAEGRRHHEIMRLLSEHRAR